MTATVAQARDEMSELFNAAWAQTGYIVYWDDSGGPPPDGRTPWARLFVRHASGEQATLANANGQRRWRRTGTIFVQLFAPAEEGLSRLDNMAMVTLQAYEGRSTPSGVWFRNARLQEQGVSGKWQQFNVLVDFEYDEVR